MDPLESQRRRNEILQQIRSLTNQLNNANSEAGARRNEIAALNGDIDNRNTEIARCRGEIREHESDISQAQSALSKILRGQALVGESLADLSGRVGAMAAFASTVKFAKVHSEKMNPQIKTTNQAAAQSFGEARTRINQRIDQRHATINDLNRQIRNAENHIRDCQSRIGQLQNQIASLESTKSRCQSEITRLNAELRRLELAAQ